MTFEFFSVEIPQTGGEHKSQDGTPNTFLLTFHFIFKSLKIKQLKCTVYSWPKNQPGMSKSMETICTPRPSFATWLRFYSAHSGKSHGEFFFSRLLECMDFAVLCFHLGVLLSETESLPELTRHDGGQLTEHFGTKYGRRADDCGKIRRLKHSTVLP